MEHIHIIKKGTALLIPVPKSTFENRKELYKDYRLPTDKELEAAGLPVPKKKEEKKEKIAEIVESVKDSKAGK